MISHKTEQEFSCPVDDCDFRTKYKSYLAQHSRLHNGKALGCDYKGCSFTTLKLSLLKCHQRTHTGEKIFVCRQCQVRLLMACKLN